VHQPEQRGGWYKKKPASYSTTSDPVLSLKERKKKGGGAQKSIGSKKKGSEKSNERTGRDGKKTQEWGARVIVTPIGTEDKREPFRHPERKPDGMGGKGKTERVVICS